MLSQYDHQQHRLQQVESIPANCYIFSLCLNAFCSSKTMFAPSSGVSVKRKRRLQSKKKQCGQERARSAALNNAGKSIPGSGQRTTTSLAHWNAAFRYAMSRQSHFPVYFVNFNPSPYLRRCVQAIAMAQSDFEGLFVSLKAAALPGSCLRSAAALRCPFANSLCFHYHCFVPLLRIDDAAGSAQTGAQMSVDDAARDELGFIAEHLKVTHVIHVSRQFR